MPRRLGFQTELRQHAARSDLRQPNGLRHTMPSPTAPISRLATPDDKTCKRMETARHAIAVLGRRDHPTDAVEDYCRMLSTALRAQGIDLRLYRADWTERRWPKLLNEIRQNVTLWSGTPVLLQYTALSWSTRGFPFRVLQLVSCLRRAGARPIIVFHDTEPFSGERWVDRARHVVQIFIMRRLVHSSEKIVLTVDPQLASWVDSRSPKVAFIPIGPNVSVPGMTEQPGTDIPANLVNDHIPTVAVFGVTGGIPGTQEVNEISIAVRYVSDRIGQVRLIAFGRGAKSRENQLRERLEGAAVRVQVDDLLDQSEIVRRFANSDVLLFVRGAISSRRGSALAAIACGLPVVGYSGSETGTPITDAGLLLIPHARPEFTRQAELSDALWSVLSNDQLRAELSQRSRNAFVRHFSWNVIARQFSTVLNDKAGSPE